MYLYQVAAEATTERRKEPLNHSTVLNETEENKQ